MKEQLKQHVEHIFATAPQTQRIFELKQEIYQNLLDKYEDMIGEGKSEQEAYRSAISSIGDIRQVIDDIVREDGGNMNTSTHQWNGYTREELEKDRQRQAKYLTIAVVLYITSVIPAIIFDEFFGSDMGAVFMFLMIAAATGLLIYRNSTKLMSEQPHQAAAQGQHYAAAGAVYGNATNTANTTVSADTPRNRKLTSVRKAINTTISIMGVVIYFIVSFATMAWYITWIIFLLSAALQNIVKAIFTLMEEE